MSLLLPPPELTALTDMDGVVADFEEPNNELIRVGFPDVVPVSDRPDFYFSDTYQQQPDIVQRLDAGVREPGFFAKFPVVEGAIDGWQRMIEAGYTPRICSSPLENHLTVIEEKIEWLEEHFVPIFGGWVIDTAIFDRDKSGYEAFAMIDDRPTLRNINKAVWQHVVFSRSYNQAVDTEFRLNGWLDPNLENVLAQAQAKYQTRSLV